MSLSVTQTGEQLPWGVTTLVLDGIATRRLRVIFPFHDAVHTAPSSHTWMAAHPAARLLLEASREGLSSLAEWSIASKERGHSCLTSLKRVGTRDVYRHLFCDMREETSVTRRLSVMLWWLRRAPLLPLSLRFFEPVVGASLVHLVEEMCRGGVPVGSEPEAPADPPLCIRRVALDDADSIPSSTVLRLLGLLNGELEVLNLSAVDLSALDSSDVSFPQLQTFSVAHSCVPPFSRLVAHFPQLDSLALEDCQSAAQQPDLSSEDGEAATLISGAHSCAHSDPPPCGYLDPFSTLTRTLTWCSLNGLVREYVPSFDWLRRMHVLHTLDLSFCKSFTDLSQLLAPDRDGHVSLPCLTSLRLWSTPVADLTPLRHAPQLEVLDLSGCASITTVDVFKDYPCGRRLRQLRLCDVPLVSVDALASAYCPRLATLNLEGCDQITSFAALGGAQCLNDLNLTGTQVVELSWLETCSQLTRLCVDRSAQLVCLLPAGAVVAPALAHLRVVEASMSQLSTLSGFSHLTGLEELTLAHCRLLIHVDGLAGAPRLRRLHLAHAAGLTRLDGLNQCPLLEEVCVESCASLASLEGLDEAVSLKVLRASNTPVQRLPRGCHKLEAVYARWCGGGGVVDISGLADTTSLSIVDLSFSRVQDVSVLAAHTKLSVLLMDSCGLVQTDLSFVHASRRCLMNLVLSHNDRITSLNGLAGAGRLVSLWVDACAEMRDLSPLAACVSLKRLSLDGTAVSSLAPLSTCISLRSLSLTSCVCLHSFAGLTTLPHLTTIRAMGVPLTTLDEVRAMSALRELHVDGSNKVTEEDINCLLQARAPSCAALSVIANFPEGGGLSVRRRFDQHVIHSS